MLREILRTAWRRRRRTAGLLLLFAFLLVNALAYAHARAMTHFVVGGPRTRDPEAMSAGQKARVLLTGVRVPRPVNQADPATLGMAFDVCHFPSADGTDLEAWHVPTPIPGRARGVVVGFHGYTGCKSSLLHEAAAFGGLGYDVLLVDFRGSGGSAGNETTIGYREADDVAAAVAYARRTYDPAAVVLYGQSMGSAAILRAVAARGVTPDALVLECPFDRLLSTVHNRFGLMGIPPLGMDRLLVFWGGVQEGYWAFGLNPAEYAKSVRCRTLLLHGALDPRVTRPQAESVFAALGGDAKVEKRFVVFDGLAHEAYLQHRPEHWKAAVGAFLGGAGAGRGPSTAPAAAGQTRP